MHGWRQEQSCLRWPARGQLLHVRTDAVPHTSRTTSRCARLAAHRHELSILAHESDTAR